MPASRRNREHVSLWHPWLDKPGTRHNLALWSDFNFSSIEETVQEIANGQWYALCNDILDKREVDTNLLLDDRTEAYLSRTGNVSALRVRSKRKSGFLIPGVQWCEKGQPRRQVLENMARTFDIFGYEALTPSSLSEKVLRSTLEEKLYISRPDCNLRRRLLQHNTGGRIDSKQLGKFYPTVYENDISKAYLYCSQNVPSPWHSPMRFYNTRAWESHECAWMEVKLSRPERGCNGIQPIQIEDKNGDMREPLPGESFDKWLWSGELQDCLSAGYSLQETYGGWAWCFMSKFMQPWAEILWREYDKLSQEDELRELFKRMMVGLPGRFLKSPEKYTLIHRSEPSQPNDIPITANWLHKGDSPMTDWSMRVEEDIDSAQLTPIGSFIVAECRRKLYRDSKKEEKRGNKVVRIYVDSFSTTEEATTIEKGVVPGKYKTKVYSNVSIRRNQFIGYIGKERIVKTPGVTGVHRDRLVKEMEDNKPP